MSKSGLFAHFQSRDNLQIAVLTHSAEVFRERVIQPVRQQGYATQQEKLLALLQAWLAWNQSFAGRCMFLDAWTSAQEGEVQQAARELVRFWLDYLARQVVQGRPEGSGAAISTPGAPSIAFMASISGIRCSMPWGSARIRPATSGRRSTLCWPAGADPTGSSFKSRKKHDRSHTKDTG